MLVDSKVLAEIIRTVGGHAADPYQYGPVREVYEEILLPLATALEDPAQLAMAGDKPGKPGEGGTAKK